MPESSPVARGAQSARMNACIDCHGQPDGHFLNEATIECTEAGSHNGHPIYRGQCEDLLAYFESVRLKRTFSTRARSAAPNNLLKGEILARQYNCFNCHGELGQGGLGNTGALKGYIPGYFGNDFTRLTQGGRKESIEAWINDGIDSDLFEPYIVGRLARHFIERQEISMPKFSTIPQPEVEQLADYVIALHEFGKMDAESIRNYSDLTLGL